jgi:hypothetical protein
MRLWPVGTRAIALGTIRVRTFGLGTIALDPIALQRILWRPRPFRPAAWAFRLRQRSFDATAHDDLGSGMIRLRSAKGYVGHREISPKTASDRSYAEKPAQRVKNSKQQAEAWNLGRWLAASGKQRGYFWPRSLRSFAQ